MASIRREFSVHVPAGEVWDAVRDAHAVHTRLAAGFVVDSQPDGDARVVTFANGLVAREVIVTVDDTERRLVWSAAGDRLTHHNGALQVLPDGPGSSRLVWLADLLPEALADVVGAMMDAGVAAMTRTLESSGAAARTAAC